MQGIKRTFIVTILCWGLLALLSAGGNGLSESSLKQASKSARKHWKNSILQFEANPLDPSSQYYSPYDTLMTIRSDSSVLGYMFVSSAMGRHERFDFAILYNSAPEIESIRIIAYRSEYGSQVSSRSWLKQFFGPLQTGYTYGRDVNALSGATISAKSLTSEINRINFQVSELLGRE